MYRFETAAVEDMSLMFSGCGRLKELNISRFDTSRVHDVTGMFEECTSLRKIVGFPDVFAGSEGIDLKNVGRHCPAVREQLGV